MAPIIVTGVPGKPPAGQSAPPRLEINDFVKNEKYFSLYVQALHAIYSQPQTELLSYYQLSGIHGLPYTEWNGIPKDGNFCVHGTVLFPTWHRPYLALFEQVIHQQAVTTANQYQVDQAAWKKAADDLRQPYWDWASNSLPPDEVISLGQVQIVPPSGVPTKVTNPFLFYKFNPIDPSFPAPFSGWATTLRCPVPSTGPTAATNVAKLKTTLRAIQNQLRDNTEGLFRIEDWPHFSTDSTPQPGHTSSLEAIHDTVHVKVGSGGHMGNIPVAAFDPIFYLHHAQVDRLTALWMEVHSDYVSGDDLTRDLLPFRESSTTYWESIGEKTTDVLNYSYPNTVPSIQKLANLGHIGKTFSSLSGKAAGSPPQVSEKASNQAAPAPPASSVSHTKPAGASGEGGSQAAWSAESPGADPSNIILDWTVRISCNKYELGGSFSVLIFLGDVPDDPEQWLASPTFVGTFDAFVNTEAQECANCRSHADDRIEGFVHLGTAIVGPHGPQSLEPGAVVPHLTENLHWRVQMAHGEVKEIPPSLEVVVLATPLSKPVGARFPRAGEPTHYHHITHGRRGGSRHA